VFHSRDWGRSWTASETPIPHNTASSGLFSIAALEGGWIGVGGDYRLETSGAGNLMVRAAQGTWRTPKQPPGIFLSAVLFRGPDRLIAVGPRGTYQSVDQGETWQNASEEGFHTASIAADGTVWAAGARGRTARWISTK
jgi:hypothetical protein